MAIAPKKSTTPVSGAARKAVAANPDLVLLTAVEPIRHNGKDVSPDGTFAAEPDVAETLLSSGAARIADAE
jgi:hypothetical protein